MKRLLALIPAICAMVANASFELLEFTDPEGNKREFTNQLDGRWINNQSVIHSALSSGLDRRLRVTAKSEGQTVFTETTSVVSTSDRIDIGGREFYGKRMDITGLTSDGEYSVDVETIDLYGEVVASQTYTLKRDTSPPVIHDTDITWVRSAYTLGSIDHFSAGGASLELRLNEITEEGSGLSHATYFIENPDFERKTITANLNASDPFRGSVQIPTSTAASSSLVPASKSGLYTIGFNIYDKAGNSTTIQRESHIDNNCLTTPIREVLNANTSEWEPYTANMNAYSNPITMRFGRPLSQFESGERAPYGWADNSTVSYVENDIAWYQRSLNYPEIYSYFYFNLKSGAICQRQSLNSFKFTLGDGIDTAPKGVSVWHNTDIADQNGEWQTHGRPRYNVPHTITGTRVHVEPRSYRQLVTGSGMEQCFVEVGDDFCDLGTNFVRTSGRGYSPYSIHLARDDGSLRVHYSYLYTYHDLNDPSVLSTEYSDDKLVIVHTRDNDTVSNWQKDHWKIKQWEAVATNTETSKEISLSRTSLTQLDLWEHIATFSTDNLADGTYSITAYATDTYDNIGASEQPIEIVVDNTPPVINITYEEATVPSVIDDIRKIVIKLDDQSPSQLTSARLFGSIRDENVYLGILQHDSHWTLEQPRIFPTLQQGEKYGLEITASDIFNNQSSNTIEFSYTPANLIEIGILSYLTIDRELLDRDNTPIAQIQSLDPLYIDDGMRATGPQTAYMTVHASSDFGVWLDEPGNKTKVEPGETIEVTIDLGFEGSPLSIPLYPTKPDSIGKAEILFDIPHLRTIHN